MVKLYEKNFSLDPEKRQKQLSNLKADNTRGRKRLKFGELISGVRSRERYGFYVPPAEELDQILITLWQKQNGRCAHWHIPMIKKRWGYPITPYTPSVDRIDSSIKSYDASNIQLLSYSANLAKNGFDEATMKELHQAIIDNNPITEKEQPFLESYEALLQLPG